MKTKIIAFMKDGTYRVGYADNREDVCALLDLLKWIDCEGGLSEIDSDEPFIILQIFSDGKARPLGTFDPVKAINYYRKVADIMGGVD